MKTIRCRNRIKGRGNGRCGRVLHIMTDLEIDILTVDPEGGPVFRCPECPPDQKWCTIYKTKDGKLGYKVLEGPPKNFPPEPEYQEEEISEEV